MLQNARNWATKHQKFAIEAVWSSALDPAGGLPSPRTPWNPGMHPPSINPEYATEYCYYNNYSDYL